MSSTADAAAAAIVALYNQLYTAHYCQVAASVLFIYDTFISFDREVTCFWTAQRTSASFLFFANKWISMILYITALVDFAYFSSDKTIGVHSCSLFAIVQRALLILQFVPVAVFSGLRVYVLCRSKLLGILVSALSLAPVGATLVLYAHQLSGINFPPFGCIAVDNANTVLNLRHTLIFGTAVVYGARVTLIAADILIIYITWTKLSGWDALKNIRQSKRLSLSDVLFRGGTTLLIMNVLHLVLSVTAVASDNGEGSYVTAFTAPITAILISHFLLALQKANQMVVRLDPDDPLHSSRNPYDSMPSFVSSLGAFINPVLSTRSDGDSLELQVRPRSLEVGEADEDEDKGRKVQAMSA
ncbi:hypothetical protein K466DRAFT_590208 [Polyporus arcularius HHB13444]|uniref:DUF6533 domain-containing protein n=1 Tax=Polyporus arcularius HHB13444 TaxID=1314778 RepID=A0A5C3P2L7_9APHY|nr:hypothetical protein K466DRAFT_590208 [Polyporus arcularius HHB13444]